MITCHRVVIRNLSPALRDRSAAVWGWLGVVQRAREKGDRGAAAAKRMNFTCRALTHPGHAELEPSAQYLKQL